MKSVLILGAGVFQVPLIKKAKDRGLKTLVASIEGDYPGIQLADRYYKANIANVVKILAIAKENRVAAILTTGTDVSVPTIGIIAEKLNLIGPTASAASIVSSKTKFREFLASNHLNGPDFIACRDGNTVWDFYSNSQKKLVIKPDDSSGSRGVSFLNPGKPQKELEEAFQNALKYSRNSLVCVEEFLDGVEVGGDAFLFNGQFAFFAVTHKHLEGTLVKGHSLPGSLSSQETQKVKEEILKVVNILGYHSGPLNFDVMVSAEKVTILEMGLRNGGNGIIDLIQYAFDVDLIDLYLDYSIGKKIKAPVLKNIGSFSSMVFGSNKKGVLRFVSTLAEIQKEVPEAMDLVLAKTPGSFVDKFSNNANLIGYVILKTGAGNFEKICSKLNSVLEVVVD